MALLSTLVGLVYLILKLTNWDGFEAGMAPLIIIVSFLGALQLFSIGFMGEYIMSINKRVMNRPLVVEEERINFDDVSTGKRRSVYSHNHDPHGADRTRARSQSDMFGGGSNGQS